MWRFWTGAGGGRGVAGGHLHGNGWTLFICFGGFSLCCCLRSKERNESKNNLSLDVNESLSKLKYLYEMGSKKQAESSLDLEFREAWEWGSNILSFYVT